MVEIRKIYNKVCFLKSDFSHKRSFLNIKDALLYTLAPYTPPITELMKRSIKEF